LRVDAGSNDARSTLGEGIKSAANANGLMSTNPLVVIPAQAGIHCRDYAWRPSTGVIPAQAGIHCRDYASRPSTGVIPAQAGIHCRDYAWRPSTGVIPAHAGIQWRRRSAFRDTAADATGSRRAPG